MRIVGGRLRGRALAAPTSQAIRPTADRLREALFNILVHAYGDPVTGARVFDLFAGTGALGLEALSRGAAFALFVDDAPRRAPCCARMWRRWAWAASPAFSGAMRASSAWRTRSSRSRSPFSIRRTAAAWPKRRWPRPAPAAGSRLSALIVVEEAASAGFAPPAGFDELERRRYDDTALIVLRHRG